MGKTSHDNVMSTYMVYSAVLALKLLALSPVATIVCNQDKVRRAHLSDLKHLTPFWVLGALYATTNPDPVTALNLFRFYAVARVVAALGYVRSDIPKMAKEMAFFVSFTITCFMGLWVVYHYRNSI